MSQGSDTPPTAILDFEGWRNALHASRCGWYNPAVDEPSTFFGKAHRRNLCGVASMHLGCNAHRVERTHRDVRLDGAEHYYAVFLVSGGASMIQNDQAVSLAAGDVALVDSARPVTYVSTSVYMQYVTLALPRQALMSHLGFAPQGGAMGRGGTAAARALYGLVRDADIGGASEFLRAESYMRLAVYDLVGALFAPSDPASAHGEQVFARIRRIVRDGFSDPDFGPCNVAAEAGISLRYVQKLFTERGSACSEFIYLQRLEHAARLLQRRALLGTHQPLSEIAYACGFRDYSHFARKYRQRFGCAPGVHCVGIGPDAGPDADAPPGSLEI